MTRSLTVPKGPISVGPGYLFVADLGTDLPANTVAGAVFTDDWPDGWDMLGVTKDGTEFSYKITTAEVTCAEYFDPLSIVTTDRNVNMVFELERINSSLLRKALNGGALQVSGSGDTLLTTFTPPEPNSQVRTMIGWEAEDNTERIVFEQAFQTGEVKISRKKGNNNATLPVQFDAEIPESGNPFYYWTAGAERGA